MIAWKSPIVLFAAALCLPAIVLAQKEANTSVEAEVGAEEFHLPFIESEDQEYFQTLDGGRQAMAAYRKDLWTREERQRFERFQVHHAKTFPDTPVPTTETELTEKQKETIENFAIGMQMYNGLIMPSDAETSAVYASRFFRQSEAFTKVTEQTNAANQAARAKIDEQSRRSRGGTRGFGRGLGLMVVGVAYLAFFLYRKTKGGKAN